jgi:hypothetical protein
VTIIWAITVLEPETTEGANLLVSSSYHWVTTYIVYYYNYYWFWWSKHVWDSKLSIETKKNKIYILCNQGLKSKLVCFHISGDQLFCYFWLIIGRFYDTKHVVDKGQASKDYIIALHVQTCFTTIIKGRVVPYVHISKSAYRSSRWSLICGSRLERCNYSYNNHWKFI